MNTELWNKIKDFELDEHHAEYSFSVRLADENKWTIYFTEQAILEYKKFMYLAASNEEMVSPSEIVDIVWHQHLIFTKSYKEFCQVLNKKIEHIPSTHIATQKETFVRAKQRTTQLYEVNFGKQPFEFWSHSNMEESFDIPKSNRNNFYSMLAASILFLILIYPAAYALRPLLITIENPNFMIGYVLLMILTLILLTIYNKNVFDKVARNCLKSPILSNLTAEELIYLKTNSAGQVIHGIVNKLVVQHIIGISKHFKLSSKRKVRDEGSLIENVIHYYIEQKDESYYPQLVKNFEEKPIVTRYTHAHFHLNRLFSESKSFANMLLANYSIFLMILLIGSSRLLVGISRDKPVLFLVLGLVLFLITFIVFQKKRIIYFTRKAMPEQFKEEVIAHAPEDQKYKEAEWQYFLLGTAAFAFTFVPLASYAERNKNNDNSNSCGTSSSGGDGGGGDGGSCGGGCGGCGGGGD